MDTKKHSVDTLTGVQLRLFEESELSALKYSNPYPLPIPKRKRHGSQIIPVRYPLVGRLQVYAVPITGTAVVTAKTYAVAASAEHARDLVRDQIVAGRIHAKVASPCTVREALYRFGGTFEVGAEVGPVDVTRIGPDEEVAIDSETRPLWEAYEYASNCNQSTAFYESLFGEPEAAAVRGTQSAMRDLR